MVELTMSEPPRARVNGAMLNQFSGRNVCVLGTVVKADGGGTTFQLKTSDGAQIAVRLSSPISEPLTGIVEVYGVAQGKSMIVSATFTQFPETLTNNFDLNTYNETLKIIHSVDGNPWASALS